MSGDSLPYCVESERHVLSCLLNDWTLLEEGEDKGLRRDMFSSPFCGWLWEYLLLRREEGLLIAGADGWNGVDISSLAHCLKTDEYWQGKTPAAGSWDSELVDLVSEGAAGAYFGTHAERVVLAWKLTEVVMLSGRVRGMALQGVDHADLGKIIDELSLSVDRLDAEGSQGGAEGMKEVVPRLVENFVERVEGRADSSVVLSPWKNIGIGRGRAVVVGARPGMGKSAFLWNWASWLGEREPVGIISLEMDADEFVGRALTGEVGVNILETSEGYWKSRGGEEQREILQRMRERGEEMMDRQVWVDWCPGSDHYRICQGMRLLARKYGVRTIFLDYLQKVSPAHRGEVADKQRIDNALRAILTCKDKLGITLVMAAQTDRLCDNLAASEMRMSMLSDTSQTEKDADAVLFLGWGEKPVEGEDEMGNGWKKRAVHYAKFRGGKPGTRPMKFSGQQMKWARRFENE